MICNFHILTIFSGLLTDIKLLSELAKQEVPAVGMFWSLLNYIILNNCLMR